MDWVASSEIPMDVILLSDPMEKTIDVEANQVCLMFLTVLTQTFLMTTYKMTWLIPEMTTLMRQAPLTTYNPLIDSSAEPSGNPPADCHLVDNP